VVGGVVDDAAVDDAAVDDAAADDAAVDDGLPVVFCPLVVAAGLLTLTQT